MIIYKATTYVTLIIGQLLNKDWFFPVFGLIFQKIHIFKEPHISFNLYYRFWEDKS